MYLSELILRNFRQFGEGTTELRIDFQPGVTALVGRNDSGKSAVIDAIRYALLTRDQEYIRVQPEDFHIDADGEQADEIFIRCKLQDLNDAERGTFIEYLSYEDDNVVLYVNWTVHRLSKSTRRWPSPSVRSGIDGTGPPFETSVRQLLSGTYLRPLRDAEREMSPGRGSRLSQILFNVPEIGEGEAFDSEHLPQDTDAVGKLSLIGLEDYMRYGIKEHTGVVEAQKEINDRYLDPLSLHGDSLYGRIDISKGGTENARLKQILERLELGLRDIETDNAMGRYGLGSNNLLYMACELLLLGKESEGLPLLLIEEPEAHLHPQRQLRLMEFLERAAKERTGVNERSVQVLLSTHSPNLASKIPLENLVLMEGHCAFPFAGEQTKLETGDYRFLQRFLDTSKANLFFAHGVLIVEGSAEAILLPVLAKLLDRDLTEYGVSIVNVGGRGLHRFSRIFQRKDEDAPQIGVPVACITDMDVMPNCAPEILGLVADDRNEKRDSNKRRWKALRDFDNDPEGLACWRERLKQNDGQSVQTFVADHWTLEYDLAYCGLAEQIYIAALLAKNDDPINEERKQRDDVVTKAKEEFVLLKSKASDHEVLCSHIYRLFHTRNASKAVTAQHLAEILCNDCNQDIPDANELRKKLPSYLVNAIDYVTVDREEMSAPPQG